MKVYDENEQYSVCYNVGMVGIIYNTTMVENPPSCPNQTTDQRIERKQLFDVSR